MRREFMVLVAIFCSQTAFAEESLCLSKYKILSNQFYVYNEKSAVSNAIMDRIAAYTDGVDVHKIHPVEAKAWRVAIEEFVVIGQPMLQNLLEYKAIGCSPDQQIQINNQISKITEDLKIARARLNALISGLPASTFQ
ncbi:MAG: hypothetical protein EOR00_27155 [Mesorhizobium sp.]|uniref:hypothetical protein n=1 Tax=Mesorhizobium sp. TaxID=1871066 RepID=UPI000FE97169|nr:hypothetical protein [Mesorhizobium sp.]RWP12304.1 MAG: hypothetical protein EOR00_27155 [Mesorhizobium sp.]